MADFPSILPAPQITGYEINPEDPNLRTQMEAGPDLVRRRFTAIPSRIPVRWRFTQDQLALFEAWHKHTALDGSAWFNINLANGLGIQAMEARFTKPPKKPLLSGLNWEVQAELEVRQPPVMSADHLEIVMAYGIDDLNYVNPLFNTLVQTTLPAAGF